MQKSNTRKKLLARKKRLARKSISGTRPPRGHKYNLSSYVKPRSSSLRTYSKMKSSKRRTSKKRAR